MKFIHLSDLHIGKSLSEFPLTEDQRHILKVVTKIIDDEKADGVLIAGDVYDKSIPSASAVELLDEFLTGLLERSIPVFIISGNHDSAERVAYGAEIFARSQIFLSPLFDGQINPIVLHDEFGELFIYMLPFIKPANVRRVYSECDAVAYTDALRFVVNKMNIDTSKRNLIIAHQFVTGASESGSETMVSIGGLDNVDASVFEKFDYVALGHIHGAQNINKKTVRYCGTPLKYSAAEASHEKSVTVVEMEEKGKVSIKTVPLKPLHDLIDLRGTMEELTAHPNDKDYVRITLTDEETLFDAHGRLRRSFPNMIELNFDNARTNNNAEGDYLRSIEEKSEKQFADFYKQMNGKPLTEEQLCYVEKVMEDIREEEK